MEDIEIYEKKRETLIAILITEKLLEDLKAQIIKSYAINVFGHKIYAWIGGMNDDPKRIDYCFITVRVADHKYIRIFTGDYLTMSNTERVRSFRKKHINTYYDKLFEIN